MLKIGKIEPKESIFFAYKAWRIPYLLGVLIILYFKVIGSLSILNRGSFFKELFSAFFSTAGLLAGWTIISGGIFLLAFVGKKFSRRAPVLIFLLFPLPMSLISLFLFYKIILMPTEGLAVLLFFVALFAAAFILIPLNLISWGYALGEYRRTTVSRAKFEGLMRSRSSLLFSLGLGLLIIPLYYFLGRTGELFLLSLPFHITMIFHFLISVTAIAIVSLVVTKSWELMSVSIGSAAFVLLSVGIVSSYLTTHRITEQALQEQQQWKQFQESVEIKGANYELLNPLAEDIYPHYGQMYEKVRVWINLEVKEEGDYKIIANFRGTNSGQSDHLEQEPFLDPGFNRVGFVLVSEDLPGYWFEGDSVSSVEVIVEKKTPEERIFPDRKFDKAPESRYWFLTSKRLNLESLSTASFR